MRPKVKFRCGITEITNAIKKHAGIDNVVIEKAEDVCGVINSLLGITNSYFIEAGATKAEVVGQDAILELSAVSSINLSGSTHEYEMSSEIKDAWIRKKFLEEVKELQRLISSANE